MSIDYEHELNNGWDQFKILILSELKRLADGQEDMGRDVQSLLTWKQVTETLEADRKGRNTQRRVTIENWGTIAATLASGLVGAVAVLVATAWIGG